MISPIAIATRGRISPTTALTLTLATIGWIVISVSPIPPNPIVPSNEIRGGGGGSGAQWIWDEERKKRIIRDDEELIQIIKTFIQCLN